MADVAAARSPQMVSVVTAGAACNRERRYEKPSPMSRRFSRPPKALYRGGIGIGEGLTAFALPHHRAYGSVHGGSSRLA